jgi:hypothetical protein
MLHLPLPSRFLYLSPFSLSLSLFWHDAFSIRAKVSHFRCHSLLIYSTSFIVDAMRADDRRSLSYLAAAARSLSLAPQKNMEDVLE